MPVAFVLNCFAITVGMIIAPWRMVRAFARGRASQNLDGRPIDELVVAPVALALPTAAFWVGVPFSCPRRSHM